MKSLKFAGVLLLAFLLVLSPVVRCEQESAAAAVESEESSDGSFEECEAPTVGAGVGSILRSIVGKTVEETIGHLDHLEPLEGDAANAGEVPIELEVKSRGIVS